MSEEVKTIIDFQGSTITIRGDIPAIGITHADKGDGKSFDMLRVADCAESCTRIEAFGGQRFMCKDKDGKCLGVICNGEKPPEGTTEIVTFGGGPGCP